jgi:hypothetical protein
MKKFYLLFAIAALIGIGVVIINACSKTDNNIQAKGVY